MKRIAVIAVLSVCCAGVLRGQEKTPDFSMPLTNVRERESAPPVKNSERLPAMIRLEVQITESAAEKGKAADSISADAKPAAEATAPKPDGEKTPEGIVLARAMLTTMERMDATIFCGRQEPRISGATRTPSGTSNSVTMAQVGTQISMTPWVERDGTVIVKLDLSDSRQGPQEDGAVLHTSPDGNVVRSTSTANLSTKTMLRLRDGQSQIIGGISRDGKNGKEISIAVRATVIRVEGEKPGDSANKEAK
jgi:type II secretory pathway component HofQ